MNQVNYQKELEKILNTLQEKGEAASDYRPPRLFLHSCCAPCSSYCLEYLCRYFLITVFYYNPNISFSEEYRKRVAEQKRLIDAYNKEEKGRLARDIRPRRRRRFVRIGSHLRSDDRGRSSVCSQLRHSARSAGDGLRSGRGSPCW